MCKPKVVPIKGYYLGDQMLATKTKRGQQGQHHIMLFFRVILHRGGNNVGKNFLRPGLGGGKSKETFPNVVQCC